MQDFRNIDAWRLAHKVTLSLYRETLSLPKEEVFGVTIQLRRSATAIATRIAEGAGRSAVTEFAGDLRRAAASCNELEYLIVLARDLGYWKPDVANGLIDDTVEVRKVIFGLLRRM
jgi:four helix bundle protein